jgi:hypothetical protein
MECKQELANVNDRQTGKQRRETSNGFVAKIPN